MVLIKKKIIITSSDSFNSKTKQNFGSKEKKINDVNEESKVQNDNDTVIKENLNEELKVQNDNDTVIKENLNEELKVQNDNQNNTNEDNLTQKSILGITINDCLNDVNFEKNNIKETNNNVENLVNLSEESLLPIWKNLLTKLKKEGKPNLHATLNNQKQNKIENSILELNVKSEVQKRNIGQPKYDHRLFEE